MIISSVQSEVGSFRDLKKKKSNTKIDFKVLLMLIQHQIGNESLTVQLGNISSASGARQSCSGSGHFARAGSLQELKDNSTGDPLP